MVPRVGETLRYRIAGTGESRVLHPAGGLRYETRRPDDGGKATAEVVVTFDRPTGATGPAGLRFARIGEAPEWAERIALRETEGTFVSDELTLRSRVVLPPVGVGEAPFPAVVLVHGSGDESAIDRYAEPYLFASHGIASLVYDKRGTGGSEGEYTQNFHVLARDVVAAVEMLGARPEIDRHWTHLAGFSQGGWIAPLAASHVQDGGGPPIRSLLIAFGPMVPVTEEDRWGWIYALRREGFGEEAIAEAQQLHELVMAIVDRGEDRWGQAKAALDAARGKPWYEALAGSDSTLGFLAETSIPFWLMKPYARWRSRPVAGEPFIDRLYDPAPVVTDLTVPSLWLLAGEDSSMPTAWTIEARGGACRWRAGLPPPLARGRARHLALRGAGGRSPPPPRIRARVHDDDGLLAPRAERSRNLPAALSQPPGVAVPLRWVVPGRPGGATSPSPRAPHVRASPARRAPSRSPRRSRARRRRA